MRPTSRTRVILQPAGGPGAAEHYQRTIASPVRLSSILEHLNEQDAEGLAIMYPTGWVRVWGVTPGANGVNRGKWLQFAAGDKVLFCGQGRVFSSATIRYRLRSREIAVQLWKTAGDAQTWEYLYFVGEPREQNISYVDLAHVLKYSPDFVVQGVNILDEEKSASVLDAFDLTDDQSCQRRVETKVDFRTSRTLARNIG